MGPSLGQQECRNGLVKQFFPSCFCMPLFHLRLPSKRKIPYWSEAGGSWSELELGLLGLKERPSYSLNSRSQHGSFLLLLHSLGQHGHWGDASCGDICRQRLDDWCPQEWLPDLGPHPCLSADTPSMSPYPALPFAPAGQQHWPPIVCVPCMLLAMFCTCALGTGTLGEDAQLCFLEKELLQLWM